MHNPLLLSMNTPKMLPVDPNKRIGKVTETFIWIHQNHTVPTKNLCRYKLSIGTHPID